VNTPDDEPYVCARDIGLVHAWMAWEAATETSEPLTGDISTTTETGTYGVGLTDYRTERLTRVLLADAHSQPGQG